MLLNWIKKKRKSRIRAYLRGFNILETEKNLDIIVRVRNQLANSPINGTSLESIFESNKEICFHQFLVYRLINVEFNKALLIATGHPNKKVIYPMPYQWREILEQNGFKALHFSNNLKWFEFNLKWYLIGIFTGVTQLIRVKVNKVKRDGSAYFDNLYEGCIEKNSVKGSNNLFDWFLDQREAKNINNIYHSVRKKRPSYQTRRNIYFTDNHLPSLNTFNKYFKFFIWFLAKIFFAIFSNSNRLIFRQLIFQKVVQLSKEIEQYDLYMFHNSGHLLRPLWTYEAERKGSQIVFYFYSTNIYSLKFKGKKHHQDFQWQIVNWTEYWVWNQTQSDFLKKFTTTKNEKIKIKGNIPFITSSEITDLKINKQKKTILIFDVQPQKEYLQRSYTPSNIYYTLDICKRFLNDIEELAIKFDFQVLLKRKRNSWSTHKGYLRFLAKKHFNENWYELNPNFDADSLCKLVQPDVSISMPYTSTALITTSNNIPTIYYDPSGKLDEENYFNNNINLINNYKKLDEWLQKKGNIES